MLFGGEVCLKVVSSSKLGVLIGFGRTTSAAALNLDVVDFLRESRVVAGLADDDDSSVFKVLHYSVMTPPCDVASIRSLYGLRQNTTVRICCTDSHHVSFWCARVRTKIVQHLIRVALLYYRNLHACMLLQGNRRPTDCMRAFLLSPGTPINPFA